jgi:Tfp pilus assembly protein PilF
MDRIARIKEFLTQQPKDNFLRHALALEYLKIGETEKAKTLFEEVVTDSPAYIGSYYHLAKTCEKLGLQQEAINWYEKGMAAAKTADDKHSYNELQSAYQELIY